MEATSRLIPKKLYKIGEIMQHTGLSRQTIHNYTMLGLLTEEERTPSGHRLYGEDVFPRIERIKLLRGKKTLKEIIQILKRESNS
jgi:DNA-binding transcriptional MerR regulator